MRSACAKLRHSDVYYGCCVHDVRQLVGEQALTFLAIRRELPCGEEDIFANGECVGVYSARGVGSNRICMDTYASE